MGELDYESWQRREAEDPDSKRHRAVPNYDSRACYAAELDYLKAEELEVERPSTNHTVSRIG